MSHPIKGTTTSLCHRDYNIATSLKIYVSFTKEPYKRDYILQKRPIPITTTFLVTTDQQRERESITEKESESERREREREREK